MAGVRAVAVAMSDDLNLYSGIQPGGKLQFAHLLEFFGSRIQTCNTVIDSEHLHGGDYQIGLKSTAAHLFLETTADQEKCVSDSLTKSKMPDSDLGQLILLPEQQAALPHNKPKATDKDQKLPSPQIQAWVSAAYFTATSRAEIVTIMLPAVVSRKIQRSVGSSTHCAFRESKCSVPVKIRPDQLTRST